MNNTGSATGVLTGPNPASVNIAGGASGYFTWTFTPTGIGIAQFTGRASGVDANSLLTVNTGEITSNVVEVKLNAPDLVSWVVVNPNVINEGQRYTIRMMVSNTGIATGTSVSGEPQDPGNVIGNKIMSIQPASVTILAGGYQEFTWIYEAGIGAAGPNNVTIRAICAEVTWTSKDITSNNTNRIQAYTLPSLAQDIFITPAAVSIGQRITIRMNVTNSGGSGAEGVVPEPLVRQGTGQFNLISGPQPASQDIPAGR